MKRMLVLTEDEAKEFALFMLRARPNESLPLGAELCYSSAYETATKEGQLLVVVLSNGSDTVAWRKKAEEFMQQHEREAQPIPTCCW